MIGEFYAFCKEKIKRLDRFLLAGSLLLLAISLLEIYSLSPSLDGGFFIFQKQAIFIIIGLVLMFAFSFFDYRFFKENRIVVMAFFLFSILLLVALFIWGHFIGGSRSWFKFGIFNLEPVEIMKISLILLLVKFFSSRHVEISSLKHILTSLLYVVLPLILIILQPDIGSASILVLIWLGIIIVSGANKKHLLIILLLALLVVIIGWFFLFKDYQRARLLSYINPQEDQLGRGYNITQSLASISSGGFLGKGLGAGFVAQLGFLPARHTDFIFAAIAEEMGFLGIILLLLAYGVIFWRLLIIALKTKDNFGRLLVVGVAILLISQCLINMGINVGLLPVTGLSLPLVSYGGSGMTIFLIAIGLAMSVKINNNT